MWRNAFIYFLLPYLMLIPLGVISVILGKGGEELLAPIYLIILLALFIFPPIYANAIYYRHTKKKIREITIRNNDYQSQQIELAAKGGTSKIALIFAYIFGFTAFVGILAAIAIPAYGDYVNRAKTAQAVTLGKEATLAVSNYYYMHQTVPVTLSETGFSDPLDPKLSNTKIDEKNGIVTVTLNSGSLAGKSIIFSPTLDVNNKIIWKCSSLEIDNRKLPADCRN